MLTSRINLANIIDTQKPILQLLFKKYNEVNIFNKNKEYFIDYVNPITQCIECHSIFLSHDIIKRQRAKNEKELRYEVINHHNLIGQGGFSTVYGILCTLENNINGLLVKNNKDRVVKIQVYANDEIPLLFNETALSQKAGNLHVKKPTVVGLDNDKYQSYLVMRKLTGSDLYKIITQQSREKVTLTDHQRMTITINLLSKIDQMHKNGIVHRDLKPDNIMLDLNTRDLQIFDFGLSKFADIQDIGDFLGTPGFISIEVFLNKGTTEKSDIFAVAIIIAMLWFADQPGDTMQEMIDYKFQNIFNDKSCDLNEAEKNRLLGVLFNMSSYKSEDRINAKQAMQAFIDIREDYTNRKIDEMRANPTVFYKLKQGLFFDKSAPEVEQAQLDKEYHHYSF
jgi:serine/threonine protein kinase